MLVYAYNELTRRPTRSLASAAGFIVPTALLTLIGALSLGLATTEYRATHPLVAIGAQILLTRPLSGPDAAVGPPDAAELQNEQAVADEANHLNLAKLGSPGTHFSEDFFTPTATATFSTSIVPAIQRFVGVRAVAMGLTIGVEHREGTVPDIDAVFKVPREVVAAPTPTATEALDIFNCLAPLPTAQRTAIAIFQCLPGRLKSVHVPERVLSQLVSLPPLDIRQTQITVGGADPAGTDIGLITPRQLITGTWFGCCRDQAIVAQGFAQKSHLTVGSAVAIGGQSYEISGLYQAVLGGMNPQVYLPLPELQRLSSRLERISYLLVSLDSSSDLDAVEHQIAQSFPSLQITDQRQVAETVSGSLVATATVVSQARLWLVLLAVVGGALNLAAFAYVSNRRRYRDFAILRAIGWGRPRLVWQAVLETCLLGVVGTSIGALLPWPLAPLVSSGIPALSAADTHGNLITVRVPLSPDPVHALLAAILLLAVGALVGLAAGLSAASIDPGRGLRDVE